MKTVILYGGVLKEQKGIEVQDEAQNIFVPYYEGVIITVDGVRVINTSDALKQMEYVQLGSTNIFSPSRKVME